MLKELETDFAIFKNFIRHNKYTKKTLKDKFTKNYAQYATEEEKLDVEMLIEKFGLDTELKVKSIEEQIQESKEKMNTLEKVVYSIQEDMLMQSLEDTEEK